MKCIQFPSQYAATSTHRTAPHTTDALKITLWWHDRSLWIMSHSPMVPICIFAITTKCKFAPCCSVSLLSSLRFIQLQADGHQTLTSTSCLFWTLIRVPARHHATCYAIHTQTGLYSTLICSVLYRSHRNWHFSAQNIEAILRSIVDIKIQVL